MTRVFPNQLNITKRTRLEAATTRLLKFYESHWNLPAFIDARVQSKLDQLLESY